MSEDTLIELAGEVLDHKSLPKGASVMVVNIRDPGNFMTGKIWYIRKSAWGDWKIQAWLWPYGFVWFIWDSRPNMNCWVGLGGFYQIYLLQGVSKKKKGKKRSQGQKALTSLFFIIRQIF